MKIRFARNKETRHRELVVRSQKNEELNPRQAKWVCDGSSEVFLTTSYDLSSETGRCVVTYDVQGLVSLRSYLKKCALSGAEFVSMLADLARAYGSCTSGRDRQYWQQSLLFDSKYVFVDDSAHLWFVFIPLDGLPFSLDNSPLQLLRLLGDTRKVRFQTPNDVSLAQGLASYVLNERDTFSFNAFRGFLHRECGIDIGPDGKPETEEKREAEPERRAVEVPSREVEATGSQGVSMQDLVMARPSPADNSARVHGGPPSGRYAVRRLATGERFFFAEGQELVLGRGSGCRPRLQGSPSVSRRHAAIVVDQGAVTVTDLGSTNGTRAGGCQLQPGQSVRIQLGQHICLGSEELVVES